MKTTFTPSILTPGEGTLALFVDGVKVAYCSNCTDIESETSKLVEAYTRSLAKEKEEERVLSPEEILRDSFYIVHKNYNDFIIVHDEGLEADDGMRSAVATSKQMMINVEAILVAFPSVEEIKTLSFDDIRPFLS